MKIILLFSCDIFSLFNSLYNSLASLINLDELKKKIKDLKLKKEKIQFALNKEKKINEDLIKKKQREK